MPPDDGYTLQQLADLADVTPRTVRYYISQGLLPSPGHVGPGARYTGAHLERIRLIKKLQRAHLPLAEIRAQLRVLDEREIATLAEAPVQPAPGSAVDYVRSVLGGEVREEDTRPMLAWSMPAVSPRYLRRVPAPSAAPLTLPAPDRSQWDRIALAPDVELHVRRPLTRHQNRLVDRLIAVARQLFEEETT